MKNKNENFKDELEKQYSILIKAEEKEQKRRSWIILCIFSLTLISTLFCVYFSYKSYKVTSNIISSKKIETKSYYETLSTVFSNGQNIAIDNFANANNLFTPMVVNITNDGNTEITYNINISNIKTSLSSTQNLFYTITVNNETSTPKNLPIKDDSLLAGQKIKPKETIKYIIRASYTGSIEENIQNYYHAKIKVEQTNFKTSLLE